jgi:hypothetical protein
MSCCRFSLWHRICRAAVILRGTFCGGDVRCLQPALKLRGLIKNQPDVTILRHLYFRFVKNYFTVSLLQQIDSALPGKAKIR